MATVQLAGCSSNWSVYHVPNSYGAMPTAAPVCNGTMIFFEVDAGVLTAQTAVKHELSLPPLQMTLEEGAMVAAAIVGVWTVGLAFRLLIRALDADKSTPAPDRES